MQQYSTTTELTQPIAPLDRQSIIEHGDSPTAIILAMALFVKILFSTKK